jgi:HSP20 family protein
MRNTPAKTRSNGLNRLMDPFLDDFFSFPTIFSDRDMEFMPRVDIRETKDHLELTFEVPGMEKDDIKIVVKDNILTVSGKRETRTETENDRLVRNEISSGTFSRSFTLPDSIARDEVNAEYKNGLLTVSLAKREEARPKEIEVKVS